MPEKNEQPVLKNRFIILVPEGLAGSLELAKKAYWLALRQHLDVLFLVSVREEDEHLTAARRMVTMVQLVSSESAGIHAEYVLTNQWFETLKNICVPGDRIVCHAEQLVRVNTFRSIPVQNWLDQQITSPIQAVSGFYHPWKTLVNHWLVGLALWAGFLAILACFSLLEIQMDQASTGLAHSIVLFVLVTLEIGSLWVWNRLLSI